MTYTVIIDGLVENCERIKDAYLWHGTPHYEDTKIICPDTGIQECAKSLAKEHDHEFEVYEQDISEYGSAAPAIRDQEMARDADMLLYVGRTYTSASNDIIGAAIEHECEIVTELVDT